MVLKKYQYFLTIVLSRLYLHPLRKSFRTCFSLRYESIESSEGPYCPAGWSGGEGTGPARSSGHRWRTEGEGEETRAGVGEVGVEVGRSESGHQLQCWCLPELLFGRLC